MLALGMGMYGLSEMMFMGLLKKLLLINPKHVAWTCHFHSFAQFIVLFITISFFLANEHTDLTLINQRIRDNIQALNNFSTAREAGR